MLKKYFIKKTCMKVLPNDEICKNKRYINGDKSKSQYCKEHTCAFINHSETCNNKYCSEEQSYNSEFCVEHRCKTLLSNGKQCTGVKYSFDGSHNISNHCKEHTCNTITADGGICDRERLINMNSRFCRSHTCIAIESGKLCSNEVPIYSCKNGFTHSHRVGFCNIHLNLANSRRRKAFSTTKTLDNVL